jgi:uncharacterized membrane protein YdjX (TVP38/TMEM64 family)
MDDAPNQQAGDAPKGRSMARYIPIVLIAAAFTAIFVLDLQHYFTLDALREHRQTLAAIVDDYGMITLVGFALLYAVMVVVVPPSGTAMTLGGGFLFGTVLAGSAIVVGATLGATLLFLATRTAFGDVLRDRAGPAVAKMEAGFQKNAVSYMLFLRLVPVFPFFVVNIVPALLGVPLRVFVATTAIGIIPGTFIFASLGAGLGSIIDEQEPNLGLIFEPQYLLPILGLAFLALLPIVLNRNKAEAS